MDISLKGYAKINLGLDILRKREDGYHEVKMIMQTVELYDTLTFSMTAVDEIVITSNAEGLSVGEDNIIYKACRLMRDTYGISSGVHVNLDKQIPVAAGMAGGSTDAAVTLVALNRMYGLQLTEEELMELGVKLGADVPYCIMQGTALSEGIGEILTPLDPMPDCFIVIAKPTIGVSTKWVYQNLKASELQCHPDIDGMAAALREGSLQGITDRMGNVLETVTVPAHPEIAEIKRYMMECGALNSLMSGSGPTVFGIYNNEADARRTVHGLEENGSIEKTCVVRPFNRKR